MYERKVSAIESCQHILYSLCPQQAVCWPLHLAFTSLYHYSSTPIWYPDLPPPPTYPTSSRSYYYKLADLWSSFRSAKKLSHVAEQQSPSSFLIAVTNILLLRILIWGSFDPLFCFVYPYCSSCFWWGFKLFLAIKPRNISQLLTHMKILLWPWCWLDIQWLLFHISVLHLYSEENSNSLASG